MMVGSWLQDAHESWFTFGSTFLGLNWGFGNTPKGWRMDLENIPKVEESLHWFNDDGILAARCSWSLILSTCFRPLEVLSWGWLEALEVLPRGWGWIWKTSQRLKKVFIGSMIVGSWLQDAHEAWFTFGSTFLGLDRGFGRTPKGLRMDLENISKLEESLSWFNDGWVLAARCTWSLILSIYFEPLEVHSWGWIEALEVLPSG